MFSTPVSSRHANGNSFGGSFSFGQSDVPGPFHTTPRKRIPGDTSAAGFFSASKENSVNGPTLSFRSNSSTVSSIAERSGRGLGGMSLADSSKKMDEKALLNNMNLADIHYQMFDQHRFKKLLDAALETNDAWKDVFLRVLTSQGNNGLKRSNEMIESQENIYDEEERNLDRNIEGVNDDLERLTTNVQGGMRRIQADQDETWRKVSAYYDEQRHCLQQQEAEDRSELETLKDTYEREKARSNAEKVKNLTRPKANVRAIETVHKLFELYHSSKIDNNDDPQLTSNINTTFATLQMLQSGIANESVDDLKHLIWHDDNLDV